MQSLEWTMPDGVSIRAALPAEAAEFRQLVEAMDVAFEPTEEEIANGSTGALIRASSRDDKREALRAAAGQVIRDGDSYRTFYAGASLALIAIDRSGRLVGVLQAIPPGQVLTGLRERGWQMKDAMAVAIKVAKVSALWVKTEDRHHGLGAALLGSCCDAYFSAGYSLVYGNFRPSPSVDLGSFYRAVGFRVLAPGEGIPVGVGGGQMVHIDVDSDQMMFGMTRGDWARTDRAKPIRSSQD